MISTNGQGSAQGAAPWMSIACEWSIGYCRYAPELPDMTLREDPATCLGSAHNFDSETRVRLHWQSII
jgi:hypothetical protein